MPGLYPTDSRLRRIHAVDPAILRDKMRTPPSAFESINVLLDRGPAGDVGLLFVVDGTHRVQAALERGDPSIEFRFVHKREALREATRRGVIRSTREFEELLRHARRFRPGEYGSGPTKVPIMRR